MSTLYCFSSDPTMRAAVQAEIARVYDDTDYIRPDVGDVIADVLDEIRRLVREAADDQADCEKVDDCTAQAIVLRAFADWIEDVAVLEGDMGVESFKGDTK